MQSKFINGFSNILYLNSFDSETSKKIIDLLNVYVSDYEIQKRNTEIIPIDTFPRELMIYISSKVTTEFLEKSSAKTYTDVLKNFFRSVRLPLRDITKADIVKYLFERNVTDTTKNHNLIIIKNFFSWCVDEGYLLTNPCKNIKSSKKLINKKKPEYLTDDEMERLRKACKTQREHAIVEFFYSTGCRVSEAANVKIEDLDFYDDSLKIAGKGRKERICYLNARSKIEIEEYINNRELDSEYLFMTERNVGSEHLSVRSIQEIFNRLGKDAGIKKRIHPHLLRKTTATHALDHGMPIEQVQTLLGHEQISTTLIYANVNDKAVKDNHRKCVV